MPVVITGQPHQPIPLEPPRKRWTRAECAALEGSGIWEHERLELVGGELISRMGKKRPHTNAVLYLQIWLMRAFGDEFVNTETPIDVAPEDNPTNEPEPDLIVLTKPSRQYQTANPSPGDLRLLVEVADSSVAFDLSTKAALYARARILEYWALDIPNRRLIVHRAPQLGIYQSVTAFSEHECVAPLAAPDREFLVSEALPTL